MATLRVLYVDDEPDLLELGRIFLERDGHFTVDTIESAPAALTLLNSTKYDAVISDYLMPDMDGIEFLKKVRSSGNHIPFILFTGRGREEVVIQALNEGADFYLQKGGDPTPQFMELTHKVRQAVQKRLAEGLLLESQAQLRTVVDSIQVGILTIDAKTHRILNANKKAVDMIGADKDVIVGQVCHQFVCPVEMGKCPVTDFGQQVDLSKRVLLSRKNGRIPILKSVVPTTLDGKEVLIESFFDISERKRSEEIFETLIRSMVGKTGLESLDDITTNVSSWLGTNLALIMEISPDGKHGRFLSMQPGGKKLPDAFIPLEGTPCEIVAERGFFHCPDEVQTLFPGMKMPFDSTVRGFVGIALRSSSEQVIGTICTFSKDPLPATPRLQEIFEIISVKAAAEIERKQNEEVLRQSEERFRVLLENVPWVAIQGYHMDGTTFFWDEGSEKTYGYPAKEAVGKNLLDLIIPAEMREDVKGAIAYMAQTGEPIPAAELSLMKKDGSRVAVFSSHIILKGPKDEMELYCLDMDLTERKQTEQALLESEEKFRSFVENANEIVFSLKPDGIITYVSPRWTELLDHDTREVTGKHASAFIHPDDLPRIRELFPRIVTTAKKMSGIEYRVRHKDGSWLWHSLSIAPVHDAGGTVVLIQGISKDITRRRRDEEMLRNSEEKFRSLVETSPDMVWEVDPQGKFLFMSPIVESIIGYTPEEIIGRSILDLVPEDKKDFVRQALEQSLSGDGSVTSFEVPARHRDGHDLVLEIRSARLTGADGKLTGLRGVAVDITERKRAEDALLLANRQLGLLSGITRHDILNKISIILGFLKVAEMKCSDPTLAESLQKIQSATEVIRSQIEFTRVYQDLGAHEPQWTDLDTVMPRGLVPETISLSADVKGVGVFADPMLERVFFNLLDNAIRHGKRVSRIRVSAHPSGEDLVVVWEDNGAGIAAGEKERIFERGFGKNTGLGMFLAREILSLTGITITETGEPEKGARFEIRVPEGMFRMAGV